jgi:hypothetical protein
VTDFCILSVEPFGQVLLAASCSRKPQNVQSCLWSWCEGLYRRVLDRIIPIQDFTEAGSGFLLAGNPVRIKNSIQVS